MYFIKDGSCSTTGADVKISIIHYLLMECAMDVADLLSGRLITAAAMDVKCNRVVLTLTVNIPGALPLR